MGVCDGVGGASIRFLKAKTRERQRVTRRQMGCRGASQKR